MEGNDTVLTVTDQDFTEQVLQAPLPRASPCLRESEPDLRWQAAFCPYGYRRELTDASASRHPGYAHPGPLCSWSTHWPPDRPASRTPSTEYRPPACANWFFLGFK